MYDAGYDDGHWLGAAVGSAVVFLLTEVLS